MKFEKKIPVLFDEKQLEFSPEYEWRLGGTIAHPESPERAKEIFKYVSMQSDYFPHIKPEKVSIKDLEKLHNPDLIKLFKTAESLDYTYYPSVFYQQKTSFNPDPENINHTTFYCFDSGTPLNSKTLTSAIWSASSAYSAANLILNKDTKAAYALSRPPGHHAMKNTFGGYGYFNNAGIAAQTLRKNGSVLIFDIDFHHGNGIQDIFYKDNDVVYISIHGDPRECYPFFSGFENEGGEGDGEGYNLNITVPRECGYPYYKKVLETVINKHIKSYNPDFLIISVGFDTYKLDEIGNMSFEKEDYFEIGELLSKIKKPTIIVQEGGYYLPDLGELALNFLNGFKSKL